MRASYSRTPRSGRFATKATKARFLKSRKSTILMGVVSGTLAAGVITGTYDDLKHGYAAARRSGRVLAALAVCINE